MDKIALVILDGIGIGSANEGNMVYHAHTPTLDKLFSEYPYCKLAAHGTYVGLSTNDDMGNSEVGHNVLGCGQVYPQGGKLVNESILNGTLFSSDSWNELIHNCILNSSTLHFIGLLSDGNVHSNIYHLLEMLKKVSVSGIRNCRIHVLLDGRDVPSQSALEYIDLLETECKQLNSKDFHACIASGGGRMSITMDRYGADWSMVKRGWDTHVHGKGRFFTCAHEAIETYRKEGYTSDQYLPPFVITSDHKPVGKILDGDSVVLFNFRGDRAIELSMAFDMDEFPYFDRGGKLNIKFAGMLQYDGDSGIPQKYLVNPPEIKTTLTEILNQNGVHEYAISETQKYGHVTYFWNGNRKEKMNEFLEHYEEVYSDKVPFEERPWMKAAEVADKFIAAIESGKYKFLRCNFANADMVGHTGNLLATRIAIETIDLHLARIVEVCKRTNTILIITADHGNADQMFDNIHSGQATIRTAHSLNPVPFILYAPSHKFQIKNGNFNLTNVAPTVLDLLQITIPDAWEESMILQNT